MSVDTQQKRVTIALVVGLVLLILLLAIGSIFSKDNQSYLPGVPVPTNSDSTDSETNASQPPSDNPSANLTLTIVSPADGSFAGCESTMGTQDVEIVWQSTGGATAYIATNTDNAKTSPEFSRLPASGSQIIDFPCSFSSTVVTVTVEGPDGALAHKSITLTN